MQYCGFSYSEAHALPIEKRRWFINRFNEEQAKKQNAQTKNGDVSPDMPVGNLLGTNLGSAASPPGFRRF